MGTISNWVLSWLAEKSTWVGFFTAGSAFGFTNHLTDGQQGALIAIAVSFFAARDHAFLPKSK